MRRDTCVWLAVSVLLGGDLLNFGVCNWIEAQAWGKGLASTESKIKDSLRVRLNVKVKASVPAPDDRPSWCKKAHTYGAWHLLSDDEYTQESPYLQCAYPERPIDPADSFKEDTADLRCNAALPVPKVAMLFLTLGSLPHEELWRKWFGAASDVVPTLCAANALCARNGYKALEQIKDSCTPTSSSGSEYDAQHLYNVYVHAPPDAPRFGRDHLFYGRDTLVPRFATTWGDHSTIEVVRQMMAVALQDPNNHRFLTISESCIPIHSALVVYQQLMYETRSRISACNNEPLRSRDSTRYNPRMWMEKAEEGRVGIRQWRKHWQFFSLIRAHAEIVTSDIDIVNSFAKDCYVGVKPLEKDKQSFCLTDEHYVSTLLAMKGLDYQTDCVGELTYADWNVGPGVRHPQEFSSDRITPELIETIRGARPEAEAALAFSQKAFKPIADMAANDSSWHLPYPNIRKLRSHYPLFARKFPASSADKLLATLLENDIEGSRFMIFNGKYSHRAADTNDEGNGVTDDKGTVSTTWATLVSQSSLKSSKTPEVGSSKKMPSAKQKHPFSSETLLLQKQMKENPNVSTSSRMEESSVFQDRPQNQSISNPRRQVFGMD